MFELKSFIILVFSPMNNSVYIHITDYSIRAIVFIPDFVISKKQHFKLDIYNDRKNKHFHQYINKINLNC